MEYVGSYNTIYIAKDTFSLFKEMKDYIISAADQLIAHHYEKINCSDLSALYEGFVDEDKSMPEDFNASDVQKLLSNLINEHHSYLNEHPMASTIKGEWSRLIEYLNDDM